MNGPVKIFQTQQFVKHDLKVTIPNCMYKLKNIHSPRNGVVDRPVDHVSTTNQKLDIFDQNNQNIPGMAELQVRQEEILQQLADLKKQMLAIKADLNATSTTTSKINTSTPTVAKSTCSVNMNDLHDFVVNASPSNPPYSFEIIQRLWQTTVHLSFKSYLHSTVSSLPENTAKLVHVLENFKPSLNNVPTVEVKLIWKDVGPDTVLLVSHLPILGEINILRYLARVSSGSLNYETSTNPQEIDSLLDTCYRIIRSKTKTERNSLIQTLNKSLGKNNWLNGQSNISIADIAAHSAIKQTNNQNDINQNMSRWFQKVETVV